MGVVNLVVLVACVLRATTKNFFGEAKCTPRENTGYAYESCAKSIKKEHTSYSMFPIFTAS